MKKVIKKFRPFKTKEEVLKEVMSKGSFVQYCPLPSKNSMYCNICVVTSELIHLTFEHDKNYTAYVHLSFEKAFLELKFINNDFFGVEEESETEAEKLSILELRSGRRYIAFSSFENKELVRFHIDEEDYEFMVLDGGSYDFASLVFTKANFYEIDEDNLFIIHSENELKSGSFSISEIEKKC